jgi:hypothetical protein
MNLVKPTMKIWPRGVQQNLVHNFLAFVPFSMNSRSLLIFLGLNNSENEFLIRAQCRARSSPGIQRMGAAACHKQCPDSCLGFSLPTRPTSQSSPADPLGAMRRACARRGHRIRERSEVARSMWPSRRLGVAAAVASAPIEQGARRARRSGAKLTWVVARCGGDGRCFGWQRSTVARQLQWQMTSMVWPCGAGEGGRRWGVSQFGWRERVWLCSPMMADSGGAQVGIREEEGSPVVGVSEAGA